MRWLVELSAVVLFRWDFSNDWRAEEMNFDSIVQKKIISQGYWIKNRHHLPVAQVCRHCSGWQPRSFGACRPAWRGAGGNRGCHAEIEGPLAAGAAQYRRSAGGGCDGGSVRGCSPQRSVDQRMLRGRPSGRFVSGSPHPSGIGDISCNAMQKQSLFRRRPPSKVPPRTRRFLIEDRCSDRRGEI